MFIVIIRSTTFHIVGVIERLHDYTCMATCLCGYLILWLRGQLRCFSVKKTKNHNRPYA
jgi:hypothetical protein